MILRQVSAIAVDLVKPPALTKRLFHFSSSAVSRGLSERLVGCPYVIRGGTGGRLVNEFLRARFTNEWNPRMGRDSDAEFGSVRPFVPDPFDRIAEKVKGKKVQFSSLDQVARDADDFIGWWEAMSSVEEVADLQDRIAVAHEDIIQAYGNAMAEGKWSTSGIPVSDSTIQSRQIAAIQLLRFAKHQGMAPQFVLTKIQKEVKVSSFSGARRTVSRAAYQVVRRPDPSHILFPEAHEVRSHIQRVLDPAAQLGALLIYCCGLRLSEVTSLKEKCLRTLRSGSLQYIAVRGKGRKWRLVEIDSRLVDKINFFINFDRKICLSKVKGDRPTELLIRADGRPFSPQAFYRAFRKAGPISPHLGRHWYAVNFLLQAGVTKTDGTWPTEGIGQLIQPELIRLQRNLGHANLETTARYLVSISQFMYPVNLAVQFENLLVTN